MNLVKILERNLSNAKYLRYVQENIQLIVYPKVKASLGMLRCVIIKVKQTSSGPGLGG